MHRLVSLGGGATRANGAGAHRSILHLASCAAACGGLVVHVQRIKQRVNLELSVIRAQERGGRAGKKKVGRLAQVYCHICKTMYVWRLGSLGSFK